MYGVKSPARSLPKAHESPNFDSSHAKTFLAFRLRMGKASCSRNLREWSFLRCREGWRGLAFRQKAARRLLCWNLWWNVARPPADRLIASVHAAAGIVRRPAGLLLKQANRPDPTVAAEIKPVERPAGHAYQVASFHLNRHHRSLRRMNVEQPASGDDVTHFVFIMGVFDVELRQHGIEPGSVSVHVNHIRRDIPAPALAFFKLRSVCAQHLLRRSIQAPRSEEHTSELQSRGHLVCRLLLEKKKK